MLTDVVMVHRVGVVLWPKLPVDFAQKQLDCWFFWGYTAEKSASKTGKKKPCMTDIYLHI